MKTLNSFGYCASGMLTARSVERGCSWWLRKLIHIICLPVALVVMIASRASASPHISSFSSILTLLPVALWLTMSWLWIPCWFCSYKDRYFQDGLDFYDYVMASLKLQLQILVMGPVVVAGKSSPVRLIFARACSRTFSCIAGYCDICRACHPFRSTHADLRRLSCDVRVLFHKSLRLLLQVLTHPAPCRQLQALFDPSAAEPCSVIFGSIMRMSTPFLAIPCWSWPGDGCPSYRSSCFWVQQRRQQRWRLLLLLCFMSRYISSWCCLYD